MKKFLFLVSAFICQDLLGDKGTALVDDKKPAIYFQENKGQFCNQFYEKRNDILFGGSIDNNSFYLKKDGITYQMYKKKTNKEGKHKSMKDILSKDPANNIPADSFEVYRLDIDWLVKPHLNFHSNVSFLPVILLIKVRYIKILPFYPEQIPGRVILVNCIFFVSTSGS